MQQHTLVFNVELTEEDVQRYEHCHGVVGVMAFSNVLNLYYRYPIGSQEMDALILALDEHEQVGALLISEDISEAFAEHLIGLTA